MLHNRCLHKVWPAEDADQRDQADIRAITQAPDGRLWLSLYGSGLRRYDPRTGRTDRVEENIRIEASLPDDHVNALMVDRGGMLWVGGQFRGVAVADPRGTRFKYLVDTTPYARASAAAADSIRSIRADNEGALWIGTDNARLLRYDLETERFDDLTRILPPPTVNDHFRRVMAMADAGHGRLWLATTSGLLRLDPTTRQVESIPLGRFGAPSLRSLLVDRRGDLWLGTQSMGALRYRRDRGTVDSYSARDGEPSRLAHPMVHAMVEDARGRIWFGTGDGLDRLDPTNGQVRHFRHDSARPDSLSGNLVRALHQGADGTVWVGGHAGLSHVLEQADGQVSFAHPLTTALGARPMPVVFTIAEGLRGELWLGTDTGMMRFDPAQRLVRTYKLADGLQDMEFNGGAVAALPDGRLAFGGVHGLNLFAPARMADPAHFPVVRLLSARIGADAAGDATSWLPTPLEVPSRAEILRLRIGALDFAPAADLRYRYRLDGFDQHWIDNGSLQYITYTQLPPGRYSSVPKPPTATVCGRDRNSKFQCGSSRRCGAIRWPSPWRCWPGRTGAAVAWRWQSRRRRERGYFEQIRVREERLKLALWASGEHFWDYDLVGRAMHSMRVYDTGGPTPAIGVLTQTEADHEIHADDLPGVMEMMHRHLSGERGVVPVRAPRSQCQGEMALDARARTRRRARRQRPPPARGRHSSRHHRQSSGRSANTAYRSEVLRSMAEAVVVFDSDFAFVSINPAFARMTGYDDTEVMGRSTSLLDSHQHEPGFYSGMRAELERSGHGQGKSGSSARTAPSSSAGSGHRVQDASGQRDHYVAVLSDITDQKRAEQELRYLANYDTLTSLPNRTLLSERLSRAIVRARRSGSRIAVLFLDLDRFKDINDSLGHAAGDRILRAVAARLQETVGAEHTVARLGGDEFTVVLENIGSADQAEQVARDIIDAFDQPLEFNERHDVDDFPVHRHQPVSRPRPRPHRPAQARRHRDVPGQGRRPPHVSRSTPMRWTIEIRSRATISAALRKVLDRNEFRLVFQPRLSLPEQRITGVEALLRWHNVEYGDIPPVAVHPPGGGDRPDHGDRRMGAARGLPGAPRLAPARTGRPEHVGQRVGPAVVAGQPGRRGCTRAEGNRHSGRLPGTGTHRNGDHGQRRTDRRRRCGPCARSAWPWRSTTSAPATRRWPTSSACRSTTLKIDKEFVGDLTRDPDDEAITSTIIAMGHSLGLTVVAEGVETEGQMQFLHHHGCDEIQGYCWRDRWKRKAA